MFALPGSASTCISGALTTTWKADESVAFWRHQQRGRWVAPEVRLSATKRFLTAITFALSASALPDAAASVPKAPPSLVGQPTCGHLDELGISGLEWGLCTNPELKQLTQAVERKQKALLRNLHRSAGDALMADWLRFISELRTQVGGRWFGEYVSDDVRGALMERIQFLNRIDMAARSDLIGMWENGRVQLQITRNKAGGINLQAEDFIGCSAELGGHVTKANGVTVLLDWTEVPVELLLSGNALRLSLDVDAYGKRHGCDASRLAGYYLPVTPAPSELAL